MGIVECSNNQYIIFSHIITYGNAATTEITEQIRDEIESMWNEPAAKIIVKGSTYQVVFRITASFKPVLEPLEVYQNLDAANNYFRIEEFAHGNISFVDGCGSNSGYFKLENLYKGSTTAAHEYGHTLGLDHPHNTDIRGSGTPGIMYPRGTLVDPPFQYDPSKPAGVTGGTMHPMHRRVKQEDVDLLKLQKLSFTDGKSMIGEFTNIYHRDHAEIAANEFIWPAL